MQLAVVGALYAKDGGVDVGVHAGGTFRERLTVVDGLVAVAYGNEVEEQAGDATVEFVKWMQGD